MDIKSDIFQVENLDERQKGMAYSLYHKCFRTLYLTALVFSLVLIAISKMIPSYTVAGIGLTLEIIVMAVQLYFNVKSAGLGILDPVYSEKISKTSYIVSMGVVVAVITILCIWLCIGLNDKFFIAAFVFILIRYSFLLTECVMARKNNKKILQTDDED